MRWVGGSDRRVSRGGMVRVVTLVAVGTDVAVGLYVVGVVDDE